ncbi:hypothetical protein GCM10010372_71590 [Streptomyces tauricus]|uniref:S1 RNA-binding domain-containing protein n=1 Tax=Streptomyces tauricus TaxID=68274 RepID=UPI001675EB8D|nr:S1 RNA-binding domain-containing protein [Streptomyces tauricus]GHA61504.1 hypothetical protein GCM10010372_71590 [Streptomyces tauricus]
MANWPTGQRFKKGDVCKGVVSDVADFGVFVDLGGCTGFVNPSEITWTRYAKISEVMREGQEVNALVIGHSPTQDQVLLSVKGLEEDPLKNFAHENFGKLVVGSVAMLTPVGVHVSLPEGMDGLIPQSAIVASRAEYRVGDEVSVEVAGINLYARQITLSPRIGAV